MELLDAKDALSLAYAAIKDNVCREIENAAGAGLVSAKILKPASTDIQQRIEKLLKEAGYKVTSETRDFSWLISWSRDGLNSER